MVLGIVILSVRPSVCLSVCLSQTKEHTADILIPHERVITLVFWLQQRLVGVSPFPWNLRLRWHTPFEKRRLRPLSAYNVWTVRTSEKCSIIVNRKLTTRFPTSYTWSAYVTPNSHKGWFKKRICRFVNKIQVQSNKVWYKVSLCENFQRHSCRRTIPLIVYICWRQT